MDYADGPKRMAREGCTPSGNEHDDWANIMSKVAFSGNIPTGETKERPKRKTLSEVIDSLINDEGNEAIEGLGSAKSELICDGDHIEGQRIDIIYKKNLNKLELRLKLRNAMELSSLVDKVRNWTDDQDEITTEGGATLSYGKITFDGKYYKDEKDNLTLCDAAVFERDGIKVSIADPASRNGTYMTGAGYGGNDGLVQSARGLVHIEVPASSDAGSIEKTVGEILEKDLGIPNALGEVSEKAERDYKIALYKWEHTISDELTQSQTSRAEMMERKEVFPGYSTFIEKGRHKEYLEKYGEDLRATHAFTANKDATNIHSVLRYGLMCTSERFARGIMTGGYSPLKDLDSGGADYVFTRVEDRLDMKGSIGSLVVFKGELFDRADWTSFPEDNYGGVGSGAARRYSPDEIFDFVSSPFTPHDSNEQMFKTGIGPEYIDYIVVPERKRGETIAYLRSMGLTEFDGKPIEEIIRAPEAPSPEERETLRKGRAIRREIGNYLRGKGGTMTIGRAFELARSIEATEKQTYGCIEMLVDAKLSREPRDDVMGELRNYIKNSLGENLLRILSSGECRSLPEWSDESEDFFFSYLHDELGLDYDELYREYLQTH